MTFRALFVGLSLLGLIALGCSSGGDDGPSRVPASVTITYQGTPVEGAHVTLVPEGQGHAAFGRTNEQGRAILSTLGEDDGAVPGSYRLTVRKSETEGTGNVSGGEIGAMPANAEAMQAPKTRHLLPEKYAKKDTTDLTVTVSENEENEFAFDLQD